MKLLQIVFLLFWSISLAHWGGSGGSAGSATAVGTFTSGVDRTAVVEAQANSTITVQYKDLTDNNSGTTATTGTKVTATATIDVEAPTPIRQIIIIKRIKRIRLLIFRNKPSSRDETFDKEGKNKAAVHETIQIIAP